MYVLNGITLIHVIFEKKLEEKMSKVSKTKKGFWGVFLFYFLVAFEFAYMAGPFAIYFYSVYSPALNFLNKIPGAGLLVKFFLPHVVRETASPFLKGLEILGIVLSVVGFLIFVIGACQIYYSKLAKKGPVLGGLYTYIRHPQYTSFIVCSFGLLLLWPRYIVIFFFVTLSLGYYFLARAEEKECEEKFGESYIEYEKRTGRFLPKWFGKQSGNKELKKLSVGKAIIVYLLCLAVFYLGAFALNQYTIYSLYADYEVNSAVVSLCKTTKEQRDNIVAIAKENPKVQSYLSDVEEGAPELLYILPTEWFAAEIPMNGVLYRAGHRSSQEYDDMKYKVIFTVPELKGEQNISGQEILNSAKGIEGKVEVWVDLELGEVISLYEIPETVKYEGVPVAIY